MPRAVFVICAVILFGLGAALVAVNSAPLRVELLFTTLELTGGQWLVVIFLSGWLAGVASAWRFVRRLTQERSDLRRLLRLAEAELRNLRPVRPDDA